MKKFLLEICVDSFESARRASESGADRLELCGDLLVGGVSPSPFLIEQVVQRIKTPVNVLLRPRFGDFCFTDEEKEVLLKEIAFCANAGVNGVVIGALTPEGDLDVPFLSQCMAAAGDLEVTLHRCFDVCRDGFEALETACDLGIQTILTSGQMATAPKGMENLKALGDFFVELFVFIVTGLPILVPLAIVAVAVIWLLRKSAKKKPAKKVKKENNEN